MSMALSVTAEEFVDHAPRERVIYPAPFGENRAKQAQNAPSPSLFPTEQVIAVLTAIGAILGARLGIFMSGIAMFVLCFNAQNGQAAILSAIIFGVFVFLPMVWLSARRTI